MEGLITAPVASWTYPEALLLGLSSAGDNTFSASFDIGNGYLTVAVRKMDYALLRELVAKDLDRFDLEIKGSAVSISRPQRA